MKKILLTLAFIPIAIGTSLFTYCEGQFQVLSNTFKYGDGEIQGNMGLSGNKLYGIVVVPGDPNITGYFFSINTDGSNYTYLYSYYGAKGDGPNGSVLLMGGRLYGTAGDDSGSIFSIDTNGNNFKKIYPFQGKTGTFPTDNLAYSSGRFYGMTAIGGVYDSGCVFSVDTDGSGYKVLLNLDGANGATPLGSLAYSSGVLYGMTFRGGTNHEGRIFSIDTSGTHYKDLFDFSGISKVPYYYKNSLIVSGKRLYGTTPGGGKNGLGNIFALDTNGNNYKDLLDFNDTNGAAPDNSLTLVGAKLYGITSAGGLGTPHAGVIFCIDTDGNSFKEMFNMNSGNYSSDWGASLTYGSGMLYGATFGGTIFKIDTDAAAGINNVTANKGKTSVYPNPSTGLFTLVIASEAKQSLNTIEIYNVLGEQVYSQLSIIHFPLSINLSTQPNGIYLYRVITTDGDLVGEGKLVIQK